MLYMILIHASDTSETNTYSNPELQQQMDDFNDLIETEGVKVMAKGLTSSQEAVRIAFTNEGKQTSLGPFTPIKEQIAGFFLIDVASHEEALYYFHQVPDPIGNFEGLIELRRVH
jgi:hypothetical protein